MFVLFNYHFPKKNLNIIITLYRNQRILNNSKIINMSWVSTGNCSNGHFNYEIDSYKGITIKSQGQYCNESEFKDKLTTSLPKWKEEGIRTVWFYIAAIHGRWIPILCDNNFVFHRAAESGSSVVMYKWLLEKPCCIPPAPFTLVAAGGIVLNSKGQVLVIQETFASQKQWKLPGGLLDPNENIAAAAVREVLEETGVHTEFQSCIAFRHIHGANFNSSDLYFVIHLKALNDQIQIDNKEVSKAMWITTEEYLNHDDIHDLNKSYMKAFLQNGEDNVKISVDEDIHPFTKKPYCLFKPIKTK